MSSAASKQLKLNTEDGVLALFAGTQFASERAEKLSGGWSNYVFRLHLLAPFKGKSTVIVKYTPPYLAAFGEHVKFSVERQVTRDDVPIWHRCDTQTDLGLARRHTKRRR